MLRLAIRWRTARCGWCARSVWAALTIAAMPACGFASGSSPSAPDSTASRVPQGVWGGEGIAVNVTTTGAAVEYNCAHGTMIGPLTLDALKRFDVMGTHTREGGPEREEPPAAARARYTGQVDCERMTLTPTLTQNNQALGSFTLLRGQAGRLRKCS